MVLVEWRNAHDLFRPALKLFDRALGDREAARRSRREESRLYRRSAEEAPQHIADELNKAIKKEVCHG